MLFAALVALRAFAGPPVPIHGDFHPCPNAALPRLVDARLVVCTSAGEPTVRIDPKTRVISVESAPTTVDPAGLIPSPMLGTTPIANDHGIAWVSGEHKGTRELWWQRAGSSLPIALDAGAAEPNHPVSDGRRIAWVSAGRIKTYDPVNGRKTTVDAATGFHTPPAFHDGTLCWETRTDTDVDIVCSDGVTLTRAGHQTRPVRIGTQLYFFENGLLWVWDWSS